MQLKVKQMFFFHFSSCIVLYNMATKRSNIYYSLASFLALYSIVYASVTYFVTDPSSHVTRRTNKNEAAAANERAPLRDIYKDEDEGAFEKVDEPKKGVNNDGSEHWLTARLNEMGSGDLKEFPTLSPDGQIIHRIPLVPSWMGETNLMKKTTSNFRTKMNS